MHGESKFSIPNSAGRNLSPTINKSNNSNVSTKSVQAVVRQSVENIMSSAMNFVQNAYSRLSLPKFW